MKFDYIIGVPATPAVWSPAGLFSDAAALVPAAGTAADSVWIRAYTGSVSLPGNCS
ncbi:MAG: hypothetical protein IPL50_19330 [Chitinophagaceae bacterium]|nr:hypothetical protein [Chitinophagaceae bacterium]